MNHSRIAEQRNCETGTATAVETRHAASLHRTVFALVRAALREIFDEAAYERFLERNRLVASRSSYRSFLQENNAARERRPRCC